MARAQPPVASYGGVGAIMDPRWMAAHAAAVAAGRPGYIDPDTGWFVQAGPTLAERQRCCGNGCRHCPYPPDAQARAGRPRR